ncbi:MAG: TonB-dependent siderophore receptor [Pseudomonadota bacterium]
MKFRLTPVAAALTTLFAIPSIASAQDAPATAPQVTESAPAAVAPTDAVTQLPSVSVQAVRINEYKPEKLSSPKYTEPLLNVPQNITVISKKVIEDQNVLTLRDILGNVPGITFGAGEGGGGYGDSINIRGYAGSNDVTVDGIRDSGQYTRSDPFNLESVEVTKGANSTNSGAGAVGGTINLVSKTPQQEQFARVSAGLGTDNYYRATADLNQPITKGVVARLNVMKHENDVPGRDVEEFKRWGVAPSIAFGLGGDTQLSLSVFHQEDDNTPQYGTLFRNNRPVPGVNSERYYGYRNIDEQESKNTAVTAVFDHKFNDSIGLRNLSRWGKVTQLLVVDPPQGNVCLPGGVALGHTAACPAAVTPGGGTYQPSGPRGNVRDTENTILTNQTDVTWKFATAGLSHTLVTGLQLTHETFHLLGGNKLRAADGTPVTFPVMDLYNPNNLYSGPINFTRTGQSDGEQNNLAVYAFDTLELTKQWSVNAGLRFERNEGSSWTDTIKTYTAPTGPVPTPDNTNLGSVTAEGAEVENNDNLLSFRGGVVFKPVEAASIYASYGNSKTPSKASVNGSCTLVSGTTGTNIGNANCNVDPEKAVSYELGAKWELFEKQLLLTAAVFRVERTNFRVNSGDISIPDQQLDGESRVKGFELSSSGQITRKWTVFGSYAFLDSEIKQSISDIAIGNGTIDLQKGQVLPNTPKHSASLWTTYKLPLRLEVGYGLQYQGKVLPNSSVAAPNNFEVSPFVVHKASLGWQANRNLNMRLNLNNLTDKLYYTRIRGSGWATPGDGRQTVLTVNYEF